MNANLKLAAAAFAAVSLIVNGGAISLASVDGVSQMATNWNENAGNSYQMERLTGRLTSGDELYRLVGALKTGSEVADYNLPKPQVRMSGAEQLMRIVGVVNVPEADLFWNEPARQLSGAEQLIAIGGPHNVPEADLFWNDPVLSLNGPKQPDAIGSAHVVPESADYWTLLLQRVSGAS